MGLARMLCARYFPHPDARTADSGKCRGHRVRSDRATVLMMPLMRKPGPRLVMGLTQARIQNLLINKAKWHNKGRRVQGPGLDSFLQPPTYDFRNLV